MTTPTITERAPIDWDTVAEAKAFTVQGPWDLAIATTLSGTVVGPKRIENRSWSTSWRGPILIHAGLGWDCYGADDPRVYNLWRTLHGDLVDLHRRHWWWAGHFVAAANLVDCHEAPNGLKQRISCCEPWGELGRGTPRGRNFHLVLDDVRPLDYFDLEEQPIAALRARGFQALWTRTSQHLDRIRPYIPPPATVRGACLYHRARPGVHIMPDGTHRCRPCHEEPRVLEWTTAGHDQCCRGCTEPITTGDRMAVLDTQPSTAVCEHCIEVD